mmetsp:Transcript_10330/g.21117  ORF Transcript_10330/g.21117 Transcript_10330/m.21117 type:complete len:424 (-) Transcript_10330:707-1978(-)
MLEWPPLRPTESPAPSDPLRRTPPDTMPEPRATSGSLERSRPCPSPPQRSPRPALELRERPSSDSRAPTLVLDTTTPAATTPPTSLPRPALPPALCPTPLVVRPSPLPWEPSPTTSRESTPRRWSSLELLPTPTPSRPPPTFQTVSLPPPLRVSSRPRSAFLLAETTGGALSPTPSSASDPLPAPRLRPTLDLDPLQPRVCLRLREEPPSRISLRKPRSVPTPTSPPPPPPCPSREALARPTRPSTGTASPRARSELAPAPRPPSEELPSPPRVRPVPTGMAPLLPTSPEDPSLELWLTSTEWPALRATGTDLRPRLPAPLEPLPSEMDTVPPPPAETSPGLQSRPVEMLARLGFTFPLLMPRALPPLNFPRRKPLPSDLPCLTPSLDPPSLEVPMALDTLRPPEVPEVRSPSLLTALPFPLA